MSRVALSLLVLFNAAASVEAFGGNLRMSQQYTPNTAKIIVTGAAGRTGKLVFKSLHEDDRFHAVGVVRTEKSAMKLMKETKCGLGEIIVADVTELENEESNGIPKGLDEAEAMIICTSSVPCLSKLSVVKSMLKIPLNVLSGKKAFNFRGLRFRYRPGQYPEKVDYLGQKAQIDLAKKLGIGHVVVVSSMGGTDPSNFLNTIGKDKNGNGNGDILLWKRKAEEYLVESGLDHTIIHPGGLRDTPPGVEEFVLDVDDKLLANKKRSISRADVAGLCVAALTVAKGKGVSFDCITEEAEEGAEVRTAEQALKEFLSEGKTTDYSL